jgi:hypothetical protein
LRGEEPAAQAQSEPPSGASTTADNPAPSRVAIANDTPVASAAQEEKTHVEPKR